MVKIQFFITIIFLFTASQVSGLSNYQTDSLQTVLKRIQYVTENDEKMLVSETEYYMYIDADFDSVAAVLSDLESPAKLFSSVVESHKLDSANGSESRLIKAGIDFGGFSYTYDYIDRIVDHEKTDKYFYIESVMDTSLDDQLADYRGFWKVEKATDPSNTTPLLKVTLYSYFKYAKPFPLQDYVLKSFSDMESANMILSVKNAAS